VERSELVSQCSAALSSSVFEESSLGNSRGKKSTGEDLCDLKTLSELQFSDIRSVCAVEKRIGTSAVRLGATAVNCECRVGQRRLV
jgi:hypothetical protein